ncbi:MAG TPA: hypothetical protein VFX06_11050 [Stellaceae bacterium]|nr:hypothetical protein [Stellaceae bacterium]
MLKRYWTSFERFPAPTPLNLGCGVTAWTAEDAFSLIKERVFSGNELPKIISCVENIDIRNIDQGHVRPNMGDVTVRGIWFPLGYAA